MTHDELEAIRARDVNIESGADLLVPLSNAERDRRALLACVDALAAELASVKAHSKFQADCGRRTSLALIDAGIKSFGFNADGVKQLAAENAALIQRCKEHEQFRHQHRDCDALALERDALRAAAGKVVVASDHRTGGCTMKINDEGTSNAAHWHERAMKAEARLQKIMARCADLLDEDQFNELDAMTRTTVTVTGSEP